MKEPKRQVYSQFNCELNGFVIFAGKVIELQASRIYDMSSN